MASVEDSKDTGPSYNLFWFCNALVAKGLVRVMEVNPRHRQGKGKPETEETGSQCCRSQSTEEPAVSRLEVQTKARLGAGSTS